MKTIDIYLTEKLKINRNTISKSHNIDKKLSVGDKFLFINGYKIDDKSSKIAFSGLLETVINISGDKIKFEFNKDGSIQQADMEVYVNSNGYYENSPEIAGIKFVSVLLPLDDAEKAIDEIIRNNMEIVESIFDKKHDWLFTDEIHIENDDARLKEILKIAQDAK